MSIIDTLRRLSNIVWQLSDSLERALERIAFNAIDKVESFHWKLMEKHAKSTKGKEVEAYERHEDTNATCQA